MIENGKEFWMDAAELMNRGIATGIIQGGVYFTRDEYYVKYNKSGEIRKKWLKKQKKETKKLNAERDENILKYKMENYQQLEIQLEEMGDDIDKSIAEQPENAEQPATVEMPF